MHQMTSTTPYRLRVEVQASSNDLWYSAEYDTFLIDNDYGGYAIHVTGYHGDAGGALDYHNGMKFSTVDVDNDLYTLLVAKKSPTLFNHVSQVDG